MEWYEIADEIEPTLRSGNLRECSSRVTAALAQLPESPFHIVHELSFTNDVAQIANYFEEFVSYQKHYTLAAIYTETNGFYINPGRWYFKAFGYAAYGGHRDYDWLSDWNSKDFPEYTLTGMEGLQAVYASDAFRDESFDKANSLASLLVVIKFQMLVKQSASLISNLRVPLLATSHDYDFIYEFKPSE